MIFKMIFCMEDSLFFNFESVVFLINLNLIKISRVDWKLFKKRSLSIEKLRSVAVGHLMYSRAYLNTCIKNFLII